MFSFRVSIHQYKTSEYTSLQFLFFILNIIALFVPYITVCSCWGLI